MIFLVNFLRHRAWVLNKSTSLVAVFLLLIWVVYIQEARATAFLHLKDEAAHIPPPTIRVQVMYNLIYREISKLLAFF